MALLAWYRFASEVYRLAGTRIVADALVETVVLVLPAEITVALLRLGLQPMKPQPIG